MQYAKKLSITKQEYNSLLNPPNRSLVRNSFVVKTTEGNDDDALNLSADKDLKDSVSETASKSKNLLVGRKVSDPSFISNGLSNSNSDK